MSFDNKNLDENEVKNELVTENGDAPDGAENPPATDDGAPTDTDNAAGGEQGGEEESVTDSLRRAGDKIAKASKDAEQFKRQREESDKALEKKQEKERIEEEKRIERERAAAEADAEERRAALEYAESYRQRLREERENNLAAKKRQEKLEEEKAREKEARDKEIAEKIEAEKAAARERSERAKAILSRVEGTVNSAEDSARQLKEEREADEAARAEAERIAREKAEEAARARAEEPRPVAPAPEEKPENIVIEITDERADNTLYIEGITVNQPPVPQPMPRPAPENVGVARERAATFDAGQRTDGRDVSVSDRGAPERRSVPGVPVNPIPDAEPVPEYNPEPAPMPDAPVSEPAPEYNPEPAPAPDAPKERPSLKRRPMVDGRTTFDAPVSDEPVAVNEPVSEPAPDYSVQYAPEGFGDRPAPERRSTPDKAAPKVNEMTDGKQGRVEYSNDGDAKAGMKDLGNSYYDKFADKIAAARTDAPGKEYNFGFVTKENVKEQEASLKLDEETELLRHAKEDVKPKVKVKATPKGDNSIDITSEYPDPEGDKALSKKEAKKKRKEDKRAAAEEMLALDKMAREQEAARAAKENEEKARAKAEADAAKAEADKAKADADKAKANPAPVQPEKEKKPSLDERAAADYDKAMEEKASAEQANAERAKKEEKAAVKEAPKKEEKPKEQKEKPKSDFNRKAVFKHVAREEKNDLLYLDRRIYDEIRKLELDANKNAYSFLAKIDQTKSKKAKGKNLSQLDKIKELRQEAKKYEQKDNERYYFMVKQDIDRLKLPARADREKVKKLRYELIELLKRRDELNIKLINMYAGVEKGKSGSADERYKAELEGRRRAYKRLEKLYRLLVNNNVGYDDKKKMFTLMDDRCDLCAELALIDYMLKKEKAKGANRKELLKRKRQINRELKDNQNDLDKYEVASIKRARKKGRATKSMLIGWVIIIALVAIGVVAYMYWEQIYAYIMQLLGGLM